MLTGVTVNISKGGIRVVGDRLLSPGAVVRCEVGIPDIPVRVPTFLRVRWSDQNETKGQYEIGFQFLC